ncbi:MAG: stimulus-sensing domain-containing protein [Proteobacteria bacterium]|nr:stimulus-sensing domain-containing protein [Pseudomonadota bacterium]
MKPRTRGRWVSPLTWRILTVNLIALGVLVAGILYLGEYRRNLIAAELDALRVQADMFAAALGEGAVISETPSNQFMVSEIANQITRRLAATTGARARLFRADGVMIVDSRRLAGPGGTVQIEILSPPTTDADPLGRLLKLYDRATRQAGGEDALPLYHENALQRAGDYSESNAALAGESVVAARQTKNGKIVLSAAVPVQRYKQVLGALMLSRDGDKIEEALLDVRLDILKVFGLAALLTILMSLYLAGTIARPILRLAHAAERIRLDRGRTEKMPDYAHRNDEIGDLANSLNAMTEALGLRLDAIERFAADVAHEIKNPLTSLRSAVETAARIDDPARRDKLTAIILDDVARLDRLISDISTASRLDAELNRAEYELVDVAAMLGAMVEMLRSADRAGRATVTLEIVTHEPTQVQGIGDRLVQVFRNLIANAETFSPEGGRIRIALGREGDHLVATVDDDGPGIPPGKEAAIFERFYTERPQGEKFGTHSGLGLSISKQIVDAHRGAIFAANRRGGGGNVLGARFTVRLPATADD